MCDWSRPSRNSGRVCRGGTRVHHGRVRIEGLRGWQNQDYFCRWKALSDGGATSLELQIQLHRSIVRSIQRPVPEVWDYYVFRRDGPTRSLLTEMLFFSPGNIIGKAFELLKFLALRGLLGFQLDSADSFLSDYPSELNELTMKEWLDLTFGESKMMTSIVWFVGTLFGYGEANDLPAVHYLKYVDKVSLVGFLFYLLPPPISFLSSVDTWLFQDLFEAMADSLSGQVYLNTTIPAVTYGTDNTVVSFQENGSSLQQQIVCGSTIIAFPPTVEAMETFIPPGEDGAMLSSLAAQVITTNYFSLLLLDENDSIGFGAYCKAESDQLADNPAENLFYVKQFDEPGSSVTAFYFTPTEKTDQEVKTECLASFGEFVGTPADESVVQDFIRWPYNPHVSSESLQNGFYHDFEALQSVAHQYYTGSLFSFEMVQDAMAHASHIIETYFDE